MTRYDFIIIGAGASGLMLADAMGQDPFFRDKSILILDKDTKQNNDRTWCFWEKGIGQFDQIIHKKWDHIYFGGRHFSKRYNIAPYSYKMIRGIDFYENYLDRIATYSNIDFRHDKVNGIQETPNGVVVSTDISKFIGGQVFNSIFNYEMIPSQTEYPVLQQHFIGWLVKTKAAVFDPLQATYMDFSVSQKGNTRFMYVLPITEDTAIVEYTLFSQNRLPKSDYENAIENYLKEKYNCTEYEILEKEQGSIPMTCYDFKEHQSTNIHNIGTAGGWAKPSTGYTFKSSSNKIPLLIAHIKTGKPLAELSFKNRFWYYDLLLLDVLNKDNGNGHKVFETLFRNRNPQLIFKFLDEETNIWEDLKFIAGCPKRPFLKAFWNRLF